MEPFIFERGLAPTPVPSQGQGDVLSITKPDPYFNTSLVHSLNESNFGGFLWTKDAALVMFYNPGDSMSSVFKKDFAMYTRGLVRTLFGRARKICTQDTLTEEFETLKNALNLNGYSTGFIKRHCQQPKPKSEVPKLKAAGSTKRANHAFAAVNCDTHRRLCWGHDVFSTPTFVLFSKGAYVGSVKDVRKFRANSLRQYVETTSVL